MLKFLSTDYFYQLEILAAIVALITYKWYKNTHNKYFLYFLWFTVIIETIGLITAINYFLPNSKIIHFFKDYFPETIVHENDWLYNIYWLLFFPFYFLYFEKLIQNERTKKRVKILVVIYVLLSLLDLFLNFNQFNSTFLKLSRIVGTLSFLIIACSYLFEVIRNDEIFAFYLSLPFWITTGTMIFVLVTGPIYIFSDYTYESNIMHHYFLKITDIGNYILYGSFIVGFIINAYQEKKKLNEVNTD